MIEQVGAAERVRLRPENRRSPVSRLGGTLFLALFLIVIAEGAVGYLRRSPVMERYVAGTNAIAIQGTRPGLRRSPRTPWPGWAGPSGSTAASP